MTVILNLLIKAVDQVSGTLSGIEARAAGFGAGIGKKMAGVGTAMTTGVTLPLVAAAAASIKLSTDLNKGMADVASLMPGNTKRVQELKAAVQDTAIAVGKSTTDMAAGLYQVESAFGDSADTAKMLNINAKLAAAGLSTTKDAINLTSAVTKAFGDTTAGAVQRVADLASRTVQLGQTRLPELAASIGKVTPVAKALGVSMTEMFAVEATLTGVTGNTAAVTTQLRSAMQSLASPTKTTTAFLHAHGYASGMALIKAKGFAGAIAAVTAEAQKTGIPLQKYLGRIEAQTLALQLSGASAGKYQENLKELGLSAGTTEKAFNEQTQGINATGFTMQQATIQAQVLGQKLGDALAPALGSIFRLVSPMIGGIGALIGAFVSLPQPVQTVVIGILALVAAIGPTLVVVGNLVTLFATVAAAIPVITGALATAATAFSFFSTVVAGGGIIMLAPIATIVAAIAGIGFVIYQVIANWDTLRGAASIVFNGVLSIISGVWGGLGAVLINPVGSAINAVIQAFQSGFGNAQASGAGLIQSFVQGIWSVASAPVNAIADIMRQVSAYLPHSPAERGALSNLDKTGGAFVQTFAQGIKPGLIIPQVANIAQSMSNAIVPSSTSGAISNSSSRSTSTNITYSPTISTNDTRSRKTIIDDLREHSRELIDMINRENNRINRGTI